MRSWSLEELEAPLQAHLAGHNAIVNGVSTDTRSLRGGDLFVALIGERFDGHDYIVEAVDSGATAALVSREIQAPMSSLQVLDTRCALGELGRLNREQFTGPLVAITGSSGKTSVKNMLAEILSGCGETLATEGNYNNEIGVPLTLLRLAPEHRYAVIEMGAARAGDIEYLCQLGSPNVSVLVNAGPAHLEGFGDLEGVASAKAEIFDRLGSGETAVINMDQPWADQWRERAGAADVLGFGLSEVADVRAIRSVNSGLDGSEFELVTPMGRVDVRLQVPGQHQILNALAAAASGLACGVSLEAIAAGLGRVRSVGGRLQSTVTDTGTTLIDDCYNANPGSVAAAIELLAACNGRRTLVLGVMAELGEGSEALHREVGRVARDAGLERLWGVGDALKVTVEAFGEGGAWFDSREALLRGVDADLGEADTLLIKGSRSAGMEWVLQQLHDVGGAH